MGTALIGTQRQRTRGPYLGKHPEQIDEINEKHTSTRYFKDGLDENIKAYKELSEA